MEKAKRYPLPKRFNASLSEKAYANPRALNQNYHYGNNYLLTILLENIDEVCDATRLEKAFDAFNAEYGAPSGTSMSRKT